MLIINLVPLGLRLSKVVVMNKTQEKILKAIDKNLLKVQDAT